MLTPSKQKEQENTSNDSARGPPKAVKDLLQMFESNIKKPVVTNADGLKKYQETAVAAKNAQKERKSIKTNIFEANILI